MNFYFGLTASLPYKNTIGPNSSYYYADAAYKLFNKYKETHSKIFIREIDYLKNPFQEHANFCFESDNPLPVVLSSFYAEIVSEGIKLYWDTASEINNAGFNLYRDSNLLAFIEGVGTTNEPHFYSYLDTQVIKGKLYRYKLSDINSETGAETFHAEIAVIAGQGMIDPTNSLPTEFALKQNHPNPFNPTTAIDFAIPETYEVSLAIYDISGRLVDVVEISGIDNRASDTKSSSYEGELMLDLTTLSDGLYIVNIGDNLQRRVLICK